MAKENYKLLVNECCNRLPYGVWVDLNGIRGKLNEIKIHHFFHDTNSVQDIKAYTDFFQDNEPIEICNFKLCLRPMSSMTDKEKKDLLARIVGKDAVKYFQVLEDGSIDNTDAEHQDLYNFSMHWINFNGSNTTSYIDWLNAHHFDYRGLIEKGLAIDSTDLGIYGNFGE